MKRDEQAELLARYVKGPPTRLPMVALNCGFAAATKNYPRDVAIEWTASKNAEG